MTGPGPGERLYGLLLRAYPTQVREEYGDEMLEVFRHRRRGWLREHRRLGTGFWLFVLRDLFVSAWKERRAPLHRARSGTAPGGDGLTGWTDDIAYSVRRLVKSPGFSLTAVFILVLAIGVNSTAFGVVNSLLFQPPPFPEPERLVDLLQDADGGGPSSTSYPAFEDIGRTEGLFESVAAIMVNDGYLEQGDAVRPVLIAFATTDYMRVLGLSPARGRWFDPVENDQTGPPAAVITHKMWRDQMASDPDVLGRLLRVGGSDIPIVGVGPREFNGGSGPVGVDMWMSISAIGPTGGQAGTLTRRADHRFSVRARLLPGVTVERARAAMNRLADDLERTYPEYNTGRGLHTVPVLDTRIDPERDAALAPAAALVMAVVLLVLAIGTLNLANLLLVRSTTRAREIAVRVALGAGRGRLVRIVMSEAMVLAALGGLGGLVVAFLATEWLSRSRFQLATPLSLDIRLDASVLVFTCAIAVVAGLVFGLMPALRASAGEPGSALRDDGTITIGARRRFGLTGLLVAGQVSVTLVLLAVASVFVENLVKARGADAGFPYEQMAVVSLTLQPLGLTFPEAMSVHRQIEGRIEALPQVRRATIAAMLPAALRGTTTLLVGGDGAGAPQPREVPWNVVVPDFFEVTGVPMLHGRAFEQSDVGGAEVAVVSRALAVGFFGRPDVVGEVLRPEGNPEGTIEIVGVAGDVAVRALGEAPAPSLYRPYGQWGLGRANYLFETDGPFDEAFAAVRGAVRQIDARIPVLAATSLDEHFGNTLRTERFAGTVLAGLGAIALLLALLGAYGVVSFAVSRRRREVGIRIALGAKRRSVVALFVRDVAAVVVVGSALGLALALPAGRLVGQTFTGDSGSPLLIGALALGLCVTALAATLAPALRAARTDPRETLMQE